MGNVRPDHVKNLARELVERFPKRFNFDFENNKNMVDAFTDVTSTKIRKSGRIRYSLSEYRF